MFLPFEQKEAGEVQAPAKVLKLSEAIRKFGYANGIQVRGCVLACAYRGVIGRDLVDDCPHTYSEGNRGFIKLAAETFGVTYRMADEAETRCMEHEPPEQIADWLEAQGY